MADQGPKILTLLQASKLLQALLTSRIPYKAYKQPRRILRESLVRLKKTLPGHKKTRQLLRRLYLVQKLQLIHLHCLAICLSSQA